MKIPKRFLREGMTADEKKRLEAWIESKLNKLREEPAFDGQNEAVQAAVKASQKGQHRFPSVWKEPEDIGNKFVVVRTENRERAYDCEYTEVVDEQKIFYLAHGRRDDDTDEIEEA